MQFIIRAFGPRKQRSRKIRGIANALALRTIFRSLALIRLDGYSIQMPRGMPKYRQYDGQSDQHRNRAEHQCGAVCSRDYRSKPPASLESCT